MGKLAISAALAIGGALLSAALAPKPKDSYGPRLSDINIAQVSPGNPIIRMWGTMKLPGQLIWTSKIIETEHVEEVDSGKKGGGGKKSSPKIYTYTYSVDCAVAVCKGPVKRINRIWANQKLVWIHPALQEENRLAFEDAYYAELDRLVNQEGVWRTDEAYCAAFFFAFNNYRPDEYTYGTKDEALAFIMDHPGDPPHVSAPIPPPNRPEVSNLLDMMLDGLGRDQEYAKLKMRFDMMNLYLGSEEQLPNSKMEQYMGIGNVPAFRGVAYIVFHNLQLEDFGNGIPTFNVEVQRHDSTVALHEIVDDICMEAGLEPGEFDSLGQMSQLIPIPGFAVTQSSSARALLNTLQSVFPFDAAESGYKIVFNWINQRPKAILRREDFGAHAVGAEMPPSVETTRVQDFDLPRRLQLKFQEPARSFSPNTVYATRQETDSETVDEIDTTLALTRQQAKTYVEEMLALKFTARKSHKVFLPKKYVILEPGDGVLVPDLADPSGYQYLSWRCVSVDIGANGVLEFVFVDHNQHAASGAIVEDDLITDDDRLDDMPMSSPTYPYMMDIPLLTDTEDDNIGYYCVLAGSRAGWTGGVLLLDITDGGMVEAFGVTEPNQSTGSKWYAVSQNVVNVAHGYCLTPLQPAVAGLWDYGSTVRVYMLNRDIDLSSANPDDMLSQPVNLALIGDELVQFSEARDLGYGLWELSGFLRGLRGTDHLTDKHVTGERFVRFKQAAIKRLKHDQQQLNRPVTYRAITFGDDTDSATNFSFVNTGNSLRPFAPAIHDTARMNDGALYVRWSPRARQRGGLINEHETQLDQPFERYEIDVLDGTEIVRTTALTDVREWTYSATMQTADFGAVQDKVSLRLYQMGQIVGRGFARELEV